jgi:TolB-like protein/DNA-binding winged helix-turn-helix (wHTH) protein/Tfp pilus assembly protein PilF
METHLPAAISFGDVTFGPITGELRVDGQTQRLRPQTAAVLSKLLAHSGQLVSRDDLIESVWGEVLVTENSLSQCVAEIRRALGPGRGSWLKTNARRGYSFVAPTAHAHASAEAPADNPADTPAGAPTATPPATQPVVGAANLVAVPTMHQAPTEAGRTAGVAAQARRSRWARPWVGLVAALLLGCVTWWGLYGLRAVPVAELSLAVLPFEVAGSSGDLTWFAEVVGEDITFNLARIPGARVISRVSTQAYPARGADLRRIGNELGVRYLVAGSVDRNADRVTLRLQLVDASTGALGWSERIDSTVADLHMAERDVANSVAHALHVKVVDVESARVQRVASDHVVAHPAAADLALQAWAAWNRGTPVQVARARELALEALALDDRSVMAWKTMASWHLRARINQSLPAEQAEAGAEEAANRALALDPDHPLVHTVWGAAQVLRGRYRQGQPALEREIQTNPSHPVAYSYLGVALLMLGEPRLAIVRYRQALAISPRDPRLSRFERHLALAYLHDGQAIEAVKHARIATQAPQVDRAAWAVLAGVCASANDAACVDDARAGLRKAWPQVSVAAVESEWPPQSAAFRRQHEAFVQGLTQALAPALAPT